MRVLTVFAHHGSGSFCHVVLQRFDTGMRDAGHTHDIVDVHAVGFDPVLRDPDDPNWMDADAPDDVSERMQRRERILERAGGPLRRFIFNVRAYDAGLREAPRVLVGEFALRYHPGITRVEPSSPTLSTTATRRRVPTSVVHRTDTAGLAQQPRADPTVGRSTP